MNENSSKNDKMKPIGFQLGVSKTFSISCDDLWKFLLSEEGLEVWLGEINFDEFEINKPFKTKQGVEGKLTVFKLDSHLRLAWKPKNWEKSSFVEMRITNLKGRARILFHQTKLYEMEQRIEMKKYYVNIILNIENKLAEEKNGR